jgi:hypothetical protein
MFRELLGFGVDAARIVVRKATDTVGITEDDPVDSHFGIRGALKGPTSSKGHPSFCGCSMCYPQEDGTSGHSGKSE